MKSFVPDFSIVTCPDLNSALQHLNKNPSCRPFAGGTDLMVLLESGKLQEKLYLDISQIAELKNIRFFESGVEIGALTTYSQIIIHSRLTHEFPLLAQAAAMTGAKAIQNRGTLGGNIVNASPAADTPPALLVYDAEIEMTSVDGTRVMPYHEFHLDYKKTALKPNEILTKIRIRNINTSTKQFYRKVGTRKSQAISKVCMASVLETHNGSVEKFRLAYGSVAPVPLRCFETEKVVVGTKLTRDLIDQALASLKNEIRARDDIRSTSRYREAIARRLLQEFLESQLEH